MTKIILPILWLLTFYIAKAQQKFEIQGQDIDAKKSNKLPFDNLFQEGTTIGTQSNENASFTPKNITYRNNLLAASLAGTQIYQKNILQENGTRLEIPLMEDLQNKAASSQNFELKEHPKLQIIDNKTLPTVLQNILAQAREVIQVSAINSFYLAGEKIEFEAVLTNNSTQNMAKPPLYVDLIDLEKGKLIHHFTLRLEDRKANFSYRLPLDLQTGNYQIRAYTNLMRNFSENGFFKKNFVVFAQDYKSTMPNTLVAKADTVIFHAEGGNMVKNLKSRLLVETKDNFGEPIAVKFRIMNTKQEAVAESETDSLGLAIVEITPTSNETYQLKTDEKTFSLPAAKDKGSVLTIDNISNKLNLKVLIQISVPMEIRDTLTLALINQTGELVFWKSIQSTKKSFVVNIPKENNEGIHTLFLLNAGGEVLAERAVALGKTLENPLQLDKKMMAKTPSNFLTFQPKYAPENGITVQGTVSKLNGKRTDKVVNISMILSDIIEDTTTKAFQSYIVKSEKEQFKFDNLDFYGKKRLTFVASDNKILLDTALNIPPISPEKLAINWKLIYNPNENINVEQRNVNAIKGYQADKQKEAKEIDLDEIVVTAKPPILGKNGVTAKFVIDEKSITNFGTSGDILAFLKTFKCPPPPETVTKYFLNNRELNKGDLENISNDVSIFSIKNAMIFIGAEAAVYGNCECAIVLQQDFGSNSFKKNESFVIEGYYK